MSRILIQNLLREELEMRSNKSDKLLESYFNGLINESELTKSLHKEYNSLNEGVIEKATDWIMDKLAYLYSKALEGGQMVLNGIKSIFSVLSKFRKNYPNAYKIFIIIVITLILLVATAQASEVDGQYTEQFLNACIGTLEELRKTYPSDDIGAFQDIAQAETYLLGLKQGASDASALSKKAMIMQEWSIYKVNEILEAAKIEVENNDSSSLDYLRYLRDEGAKLIKSSFTKIGGPNSTNISIKQGWSD